ncbi:nucleoside deaminase [Streptosporangium saharense]|uniref:tRNA(Arg) A34 adenosine deaminase TadA n=1 Tax=Streptosporangium saharense TaxID=1706840 RepID=A0A7W7QKP6_9ACTN|nr:nucleoside deaminase [Streptosporangium saharense]MBB4915370.1 tRNA(Arg) A34 adenosine deaminase TadA [Streptosporangium saharense]
MTFTPAVTARLDEAMAVAIDEARRAARPFGAVLMDAEEGHVLVRARNTAADGDPTAHAEVNAIRAAAPLGIDLTRTILVSTAAPCVMCAGAAIWARVRGVVAACDAALLAELGWKGMCLPPEGLSLPADPVDHRGTQGRGCRAVPRHQGRREVRHGGSGIVAPDDPGEPAGGGP